MTYRLLATTFLFAVLAGCGSDDATLTIEELMKPETCMTCHPVHYREWSGSMHAYAAEDPVFLAMNARGQRETNGTLGTFCINCHAPMAVRLGLTTDGLNLDEVPAYAKGITCFFCHSVEEITSDHNNPLVLANDGVMRGGIRNPVDNPAHNSKYSALLDSSSMQSSATCGACHDIVTPNGVHLERTFEEWKASIFSSEEPASHLSCGACHIRTVSDVVADVPDLNVPLRQRSNHTFAGIDVALTPFPEMAAQREEIENILKQSVLPKLCVQPLDGGIISYRLDALSGHNFPSGASNDRRAWVEIIAYDAADNVVFSTGVVPVDEDPNPLTDPNLWEIRDHGFDAEGQPTEMFWTIVSISKNTLGPRVTNDVGSPLYDHSTTKTFSVAGLVPQIARVTARLQIRPISFSLINDLEESGDLTVDVRPSLVTHEVTGTVLEWTPTTGDLDRCVVP